MSANTILAAPKQPRSCGSGAAICSPSSWTGDETGLPIIRTGTPFRCHGDAIIDDLRVVRARLERTLKELRACTTKCRRFEKRYDIGTYLEDVLSDIEDWASDSMDQQWFRRRSRSVIACVSEAESDYEEDDYPVPEKATWNEFRDLSQALMEHGLALRRLQESEFAAISSPVNASCDAAPENPNK